MHVKGWLSQVRFCWGQDRLSSLPRTETEHLSSVSSSHCCVLNEAEILEE